MLYKRIDEGHNLNKDLNLLAFSKVVLVERTSQLYMGYLDQERLWDLQKLYLPFGWVENLQLVLILYHQYLHFAYENCNICQACLEFTAIRLLSQANLDVFQGKIW